MDEKIKVFSKFVWRCVRNETSTYGTVTPLHCLPCHRRASLVSGADQPKMKPESILVNWAKVKHMWSIRQLQEDFLRDIPVFLASQHHHVWWQSCLYVKTQPLTKNDKLPCYGRWTSYFTLVNTVINIRRWQQRCLIKNNLWLHYKNDKVTMEHHCFRG